jgi:hypothetical protein
LVALAVSGYAFYRRGPQGPRGEKGDVGDTGPRGPQGETKTITVARQADVRPKFLSEEDRRSEIATKADDPEFQQRLDKITKHLRDTSGTIPADVQAQTSQPDWRRRNSR